MNTAKKWIAAFSAGLFALSACPLLTSVQAADVDREQVLLDTYQQWKKTYVTEDTYISSGKPQYYVSYEENRYAGDGVSVPVTVSEAHGYGMLITVCMADYDAQAKDTFDGMYRYYRAHLSDIGENLMSWQQCDNGSALTERCRAEMQILQRMAIWILPIRCCWPTSVGALVRKHLIGKRLLP